MSMLLISKDSFEELLCDAINQKDDNGKHICAGLMSKIVDINNNSIMGCELEQLIKGLREIEKMTHMCYKNQYIDTNKVLDNIENIAIELRRMIEG